VLRCRGQEAEPQRNVTRETLVTRVWSKPVGREPYAARALRFPGKELTGASAEKYARASFHWGGQLALGGANPDRENLFALLHQAGGTLATRTATRTIIADLNYKLFVCQGGWFSRQKDFYGNFPARSRKS